MKQYFAWSESNLAIINGHTAHFVTSGPLHAAAVLALKGEDIVCAWGVAPDARGRFAVRYQPGFQEITALKILFAESGAGYMERDTPFPVSAGIVAEDTLPVRSPAEVSWAAKVGLLPQANAHGAAATPLAPRVEPSFNGEVFEFRSWEDKTFASSQLCGFACDTHYAKFTYEPEVVPRTILGYRGETITDVWTLHSVPMWKMRILCRGGWPNLTSVQVLYHDLHRLYAAQKKRRFPWRGLPAQSVTMPTFTWGD